MNTRGDAYTIFVLSIFHCYVSNVDEIRATGHIEADYKAANDQIKVKKMFETRNQTMSKVHLRLETNHETLMTDTP